MRRSPRRVRDKLVITVSGLHGSGRTTHALKLAEAYGLRYVSSGTIFREIAMEKGLTLEEMSRLTEDNPEIDRLIDERAREESKKEGIVIDATLAGWMAENPDLRIFLKTPFEARIRRISEREGITYEEAERETVSRSESEKERFQEYYGVDIADLSIYDNVLNTDLFEPEATSRILKSQDEEYCNAG